MVTYLRNSHSSQESRRLLPAKCTWMMGASEVGQGNPGAGWHARAHAHSHAHANTHTNNSWVQLSATQPDRQGDSIWIVISRSHPNSPTGPRGIKAEAIHPQNPFECCTLGYKTKATDKQTLGIISNCYTRVNKDGNGAIPSEPAAPICHKVFFFCLPSLTATEPHLIKYYKAKKKKRKLIIETLKIQFDKIFWA